MNGVSIVTIKEKETILGNMEDGQIAIVRSWRGREPSMVGEVVQRYGDTLILVGKRHGLSYTTCFGYEWSKEDQYKVEILEPGTTLVIN